jgi:hypothetical protein
LALLLRFFALFAICASFSIYAAFATPSDGVRCEPCLPPWMKGCECAEQRRAYFAKLPRSVVCIHFSEVEIRRTHNRPIAHVCQQEIAFLHAIGFRECDRRGSCHALAMQHPVRELRQRLTTFMLAKKSFFYSIVYEASEAGARA